MLNAKQNVTKLGQFPVAEKLVNAELIYVNDIIHGCVLTFENGTFIELYNEYGSKIYTNAEPKMQDAWEVKAMLFSVDLTQRFNEKSTAERYSKILENVKGVTNIELNKIKVLAEEILVKSEEIPF